MFSFFKGKILNYNYDKKSALILTDSGLGFEVSCDLAMNDGEVGKDIEIYIHTNVSETKISYWGFIKHNELELFKMMLSVNGVGPSSAFSIISTLGTGNIVRAIIENEPNLLKVPGVGLKTAQKIIIDLKNKISDSKYTDGPVASTNKPTSDAIAALESLGYNKSELLDYYRNNKFEGELTAEELIKKYLSKDKHE